jgi:hypothetical protein
MRNPFARKADPKEGDLSEVPEIQTDAAANPLYAPVVPALNPLHGDTGPSPVGDAGPPPVPPVGDTGPAPIPTKGDTGPVAPAPAPAHHAHAAEWAHIDLAAAPDCAMAHDRHGWYVTVGGETIRTGVPREWQAAWREAHPKAE